MKKKQKNPIIFVVTGNAPEEVDTYVSCHKTMKGAKKKKKEMEDEYIPWVNITEYEVNE